MTLDISIHRSILIKILKDIYSDTTIGPILGFKGGTAALLFYDLNRFSIDLDFDLLDPEKEDYVFERIKEILQEYGAVKRAEKKRFNLFYLLSYDKKKKGAQNIKVDINRRNFSSRYEARSHLGISMNVIFREDMAAHKMIAMCERIGKTNRDIYDVYFFLHNDWPVNKKIIEERTGSDYKKLLTKCIRELEQIKGGDIFSGMGQLLDEKQKVWAKSHLVPETIFLLKLELEKEK